jgi:hypothetical protein
MNLFYLKFQHNNITFKHKHTVAVGSKTVEPQVAYIKDGWRRPTSAELA